jgi:hypothetical protein
MDVQNDIPNVRSNGSDPTSAPLSKPMPDICPTKSVKLATLEKERLHLDLDAGKRIVVLDLTEAGSKPNAA